MRPFTSEDYENLEDRLLSRYYEPRRLDAEIFPVLPVGGSGRVCF